MKRTPSREDHEPARSPSGPPASLVGLNDDAQVRLEVTVRGDGHRDRSVPTVRI